MLNDIYPEPEKELVELLIVAYNEIEENGAVNETTAFKLSKLEKKEIAESLTAYGLWHQNAEAKLRAKKAELEPIIKELESEIKFHQRRVELIEWRIKCILTPSLSSSLTNEKVDIFYTGSESLEITAPDAVPIEYCRVSYAPEVQEIKAAIKTGAKIDFARIKKNFNLQVKPGGEKALANAKKRAKKREQEESEERFEVPEDIL